MRVLRGQRVQGKPLKRRYFQALALGISRDLRTGSGFTQNGDSRIRSGRSYAADGRADPGEVSRVNRSGTVPLLSVPKYFGLQCSYPTSRGNTMKKMIAAVLAGLFAAVTASSIVVAAEPKKDDAKKTEKKAEKK